MTDLAHDFAEDGVHEIHLSGKQLVFLFMATTVVAVLIFLCGVQVGRGAPVSQQASEPFGDPPAAVSGTSAPVPAPAPVGDASPQAAEPPAPAAEGEELGYKRRLEEESEPAAPVKPVPPAAAPVAAQKAQPAPRPSQSDVWVVQVHAGKDRRIANSIVQRLTRRGYSVALVPAGAPSGMYKVQVGRFTDRAEAEKLRQRLEKQEQFKPWVTR